MRVLRLADSDTPPARAVSAEPQARAARAARAVRTEPPAPAEASASATRATDRSARAGVPGRRTIAIQGRGSERYTPATERRRPPRRPHERAGFRPDRAAMWAVLLGLLLVLVAATSSHAAVLGAHHALTASGLIASR